MVLAGFIPALSNSEHDKGLFIQRDDTAACDWRVSNSALKDLRSFPSPPALCSSLHFSFASRPVLYPFLRRFYVCANRNNDKPRGKGRSETESGERERILTERRADLFALFLFRRFAHLFLLFGYNLANAINAVQRIKHQIKLRQQAKRKRK